MLIGAVDASVGVPLKNITKYSIFTPPLASAVIPAGRFVIQPDASPVRLTASKSFAKVMSIDCTVSAVPTVPLMVSLATVAEGGVAPVTIRLNKHHASGEVPLLALT